MALDGTHRRALVVDNDRFYVELVADILAQEGYEVIRAYDGLEALDALRETVPDIAFLDIVMPKIDGDRLCRYLKANPQTRGCRVVVLSATLVEDPSRLARLGADAYIAKGRLDDVRKNIQAALQQWQADRVVLGLEDARPRELVKELLALKQYQDALLQNMAEGVLQVDVSGVVVYANPAALRIVARSEADVIGRSVLELFEGSARQEVATFLTALTEAARPLDEPITIRMRGQVLGLLPVRMMIKERFDGFYIILQDLTLLHQKIAELSEANLRLQETDHLRADFLAMISHDLHTPLTAIKVSLDMLVEEEGDAGMRKELLGIARQEAERLGRMVEDLLDLARIESGRLELRHDRIDLGALLEQARERVRALARERGIGLALQVRGTLPIVWGDPERIAQVLMNLLGNALKFTGSGGRVRLEAAVLPDEVLVTVADTGRGIPAKDLERFFQKFARGEDEAAGAGLGLYICRAIVESHGGRIWAESEEGKGSQFFLTLPRGERHA